MQPMRLCICSGSQFENTFENTLWGKILQYKCTHCDYASVQAGGMRTHLKTHSGEKPYKCSQCDFAYAQAGHLRRHLTTHSGEKSYKCTQCDYVSAYPYHMKRHLKSHTG